MQIRLSLPGSENWRINKLSNDDKRQRYLMRGLLLTAVVGLLAWFWSNSLRARENAIATSARACRSLGLQLLDDTVALKRIGLGRKESGRVSIQRVYNFEFTQDGDRRWQGHVALQGARVQAVHLDHPDGPVVMQPNQIQ